MSNLLSYSSIFEIANQEKVVEFINTSTDLQNIEHPSEYDSIFLKIMKI